MRRLISSSAAMAAGTFILTSGVAAAQSTTGPLRDGGFYHGPGMMGGYGSMGGFGMFFGFFVMLLVLAAIAIVIGLLMRSAGVFGSSGTATGSNSNTAVDILKERFAKGDIDAKEFDERKRHLAT